MTTEAPSKTRLGWHFISADWRSAHGNQVWKDGEVERYEGRYKIKPCERGLHSSPTPWDALQYAPGPLLSLVEIPEEGDECIPHDGNKHVSTWRRRILTIDISKELRLFACDVAEEALNREVQRGNTVDERSRAAIEVARRFAQGQATDQELDAAWDAARDAARAAAWAAARDAAWAAAWAAARAAAWAAAWAAARDAARDAAWAAARQKFNALIEPLFETALAGAS